MCYIIFKISNTEKIIKKKNFNKKAQDETNVDLKKCTHWYVFT